MIGNVRVFKALLSEKEQRFRSLFFLTRCVEYSDSQLMRTGSRISDRISLYLGNIKFVFEPCKLDDCQLNNAD